MNRSIIAPEDALQLLKEGNARYVNNSNKQYDYLTAVKETATGQHPFAAIVGCIDSREVPELLFNQNIGDLFSIRVAGNVISKDVMASIEFSCKLSTARLVVVCGHTGCGAVKGACDGVSTGYLSHLLHKIEPAIEEAKALSNGLEDAAFRDLVAKLNVQNSIKAISHKSALMRELIEKGEVKVAGALYDVHTGKVTFMD